MAAKFYGLFEAKGKVGVVAYKLKLPPNGKIHPVFSRVTPKKEDWIFSTGDFPLPEPDTQDRCPLLPEMILKRRGIL